MDAPGARRRPVGRKQDVSDRKATPATSIFFAKILTKITKGQRTQRGISGIISGMSLDGKSFFYANPLEVASLGSPDGT